MKAIPILVVASVMTLGMTMVGVAHAQGSRQATPTANETIVSPTMHPNPLPAPEPKPLFKLGNMPVGVWAPVEPPYDSTANRNNAANPLWYAATSTSTW